MERGKILVTGGVGYIGSHTVVALHQAGYEPIIVDNLANSSLSALEGIQNILNAKIPFHNVDCRDAKGLDWIFNDAQESGRPIEGAIHFAAYKAVGESVERPIEYFQNNIGSTASLLQIMAQYGVNRLVFSSSCTVYGEPNLIPVDELAPILPAESPYGYTKQACERLIQDVVIARPELRVALLRYFNPIGAHPSGLIGELPLGRPNNLIPFLTQASAGEREPLIVFGQDYPTADGTCIRDYIHVVDLAEAHVASMDWLFQSNANNKKQGATCEPFNLGTGKGSSVKEVIQTFEAVNGVRVPHRFGPRRSGDVVAIYAKADKAKELLGWSARKSLGDALEDAWRWQQGAGSIQRSS